MTRKMMALLDSEAELTLKKKYLYWVESSMIPEFQNGSGVPELSPEWFRNPEPFWNVPKYVLFHIFYITGLIIASIT